MRLSLTVTAPNWAANAPARLEQGRRAQMADVLRLVADRLQQGQEQGTFTRPELEVAFRVEPTPADETADAAA
jgi:hypothetical protein